MRRALIAATVLLLALPAAAQAYPDKPVRFVVPFPPGGIADGMARLYAAKLGEVLGQQMVVENKPGAGGNVAAEYVARTPADGYTLFQGTAGTHGINPSLYKAIPYDARKDFAAISLMATLPSLLAVHPSVPAKDVKELIAHAKANPGKLNYGTPGNGTLPHLSMELFKSMTGADLTHVPYRGAAAAVTDALAGQIQVVFDVTALPHVKNGALRGLGVSSTERWSALPALPTVAEAGVPGFAATGWFGLFAPSGTPRAVVDKLNAAVASAAAQPDMQTRFVEIGAQVRRTSPEDFAAFVDSEIKKWAEVVQKSGAKLD